MLTDREVMTLLIRNCERVAPWASPAMRRDLEAWLELANTELGKGDVVMRIPRRPVTRSRTTHRSHLRRVV